MQPRPPVVPLAPNAIQKGTPLKVLMNRESIECLAQKLPEYITVDLSELKKGDSIHARDLKLDAGIKIVRHGNKDITLASLVEPKAEAELTVAPVAAPEKGKGKGKKDEKQNKK